MDAVSLSTGRLVLRPWRDDDREPFAALNADPQVMRFFPSTLTREESDAGVDRIQAQFAERGWGLWAVEVVGGAPFAGFVGLNRPRFDAAFTPTTEIGWRLAREHWGRGYATEAGHAAIAFGFDVLALEEIVAFTTVANAPSRRVMDRLGMTRDAHGDFEHPAIPEGDPTRPHVLYRLRRKDHAARSSADDVAAR